MAEYVTKFYVRRYFPNARSDEGAAMASQSWGPYSTETEAVRELARLVRHEGVDLRNNLVNAHLRNHEFYVDRAARFDQAADIVEQHQLTKVNIQGVVYDAVGRPIRVSNRIEAAEATS